MFFAIFRLKQYVLPAPKDHRYIQRKCGADFRLSIGRLWKDPVEEKRHNTPHSDRYGVRVRRTPPATGIYTKVSVVPYHPFYKKTSTFSIKDLRKTLSQICNVKGITPLDTTKLSIFQKRTTLTGVLLLERKAVSLS